MPTENPLLGPILRHAETDPEALSATYHDPKSGWHPVTRATTLTRANAFARLLRAEGAGLGDIVLLIADHGPDAHAAFLGAMLAGCAPAFLPQPSAKQDHATYWAQHRIVFQFARAALVVAPDARLAEVAACAEGSGTRAVAVSTVERHVRETGPIDPPPADAVALLQHSSGTTGLKKGVALTHAAIAAQLAAYAPTLGATQSMRIATWLPLYHDMGLVSSFLLPMWLGVPIVSLDPFVWISTPRLMLDAIAEHRGTHAWMPNFAFLVLARAARDGGRRWDLSSVRALISCSEPCKPDAFAMFSATFTPHGLRENTLHTCYAMAETVFAVSQSVVGRPIRTLKIGGGAELLSNGPPIPGAAMRVVRDGTVVADGEVGELQVSAPFLFRGYHNNPETTEAALDGDWYRTGDLGCVDGGEVFVTGRLKDVIIVQGRNVMAHDVEAAVSRVHGVKPGRCVAFGRFNERHGSEELVVVAERDGTDDPTLAIGDAVMADIGVACADIRMVEPGWLVKTSSGKTSRSDNARKYAEMIR